MNEGTKRYMMSKEIILSVRTEVEAIMGSISINVVINHSIKNRKQVMLHLQYHNHCWVKWDYPFQCEVQFV